MGRVSDPVRRRSGLNLIFSMTVLLLHARGNISTTPPSVVLFSFVSAISHPAYLGM